MLMRSINAPNAIDVSQASRRNVTAVVILLSHAEINSWRIVFEALA